jgi:hypothetical protein
MYVLVEIAIYSSVTRAVSGAAISYPVKREAGVLRIEGTMLRHHSWCNRAAYQLHVGTRIRAPRDGSRERRTQARAWKREGRVFSGAALWP